MPMAALGMPMVREGKFEDQVCTWLQWWWVGGWWSWWKKAPWRPPESAAWISKDIGNSDYTRVILLSNRWSLKWLVLGTQHEHREQNEKVEMFLVLFFNRNDFHQYLTSRFMKDGKLLVFRSFKEKRRTIYQRKKKKNLLLSFKGPLLFAVRVN